jgi:vancomycin permeability regulator SanA
MKVAFKYTIVILALWFSIHTIAILVDGLNDERIKSDVGVVLGNKVNPDGSLSERLISRLDKALELYNDSTIRLIFVSGGLGKEGFYEGTKMYDYLAENGVPKDRIIVDNFGNTTEATAINFQKLYLNGGSVLVVSQYYHISRTKLAFKNVGFKKINGVHAEYFEIRDFYSIIREFVGYYKYLLD